jgi:WD40 repeat protein
LIQGIIRKSAQVLVVDKTQLAGQLLGRLLNLEMPEIQGMLTQAKQWKDCPWLRPLKANLELVNEDALRTLTGHTGTVLAVAIALLGKNAISASRDKTLKIWDIESGTEVRSLTGHTDWVDAVAIAPPGKLAISASEDHTLRIWDMERGTEERSLTGHTEDVTAVAIAPDGKTAVSEGCDQTLKIWDIESGKCLRTLTGHTRALIAVAIALLGKNRYFRFIG